MTPPSALSWLVRAWELYRQGPLEEDQPEPSVTNGCITDPLWHAARLKHGRAELYVRSDVVCEKEMEF